MIYGSGARYGDRVVRCASPGAPVMLDETGVRELLKGVELEKGDIEADRDRFKERAKNEAQRADTEHAEAERQRARAVWLPIVTTTGAVAVVMCVVLGTLKAAGALTTPGHAP